MEPTAARYKSLTSDVEDVSPDDLHVLRETHKYIFYGPMLKDLKNTYFGAVYLFEKKLRIQAGQKVTLAHGSKETYGVALVGQAQNRQVWVWLVSFQTEDVVKRLIVQVHEIVGQQTPHERELCRNALARYQRRSRSYAAYVQHQAQLSADSQSDHSPSSPSPARNMPTRQTRSQNRSDEEDPKPRRQSKRKTAPIEEEDSDFDSEESKELSETSSEEELPRRRSPPVTSKRPKWDRSMQIRKQTGALFLSLLEIVVTTLANEYPQAV